MKKVLSHLGFALSTTALLFALDVSTKDVKAETIHNNTPAVCSFKAKDFSLKTPCTVSGGYQNRHFTFAGTTHNFTSDNGRSGNLCSEGKCTQVEALHSCTDVTYRDLDNTWTLRIMFDN